MLVSRVWQAAFVVGVAMAAAGCDAGGLLVLEKKGVIDPGTAVPANNSTELVSSGTLASNSKYRLIYTMGQATPNQGVGTSADHKLKGGLIGATQPD